MSCANLREFHQVFFQHNTMFIAIVRRIQKIFDCFGQLHFNKKGYIEIKDRIKLSNLRF